MSAIDLPADDREGGDMHRRLLLVSIFSIGSLLVTATPAMAVGIVDQEQLDVSMGLGFVATGLVCPLSQTFTPGMSGALDSIALYPDEDDSGSTVEIRTASNGVPTTTVLASQTITSTEKWAWVTTTFASPARVVAGTQYAIVMVPPTPPPAFGFGMAQQFSNPYPGGNLLYANCPYSPNHWVTAPLYDFGFVTYVTPAQPDGLISKGSRKFVGNDIHNTDGTQQTRLATPHIGDLVLFRVAVQNDGIVPDSFRIQAAGSEPYYSIRYYRHSKEITSRVVAGTFTTPVLAPGDRYVIRVWVKVATLAAAPSASRLVTLTSVNDPTKVDAVQFVVRPQ